MTATTAPPVAIVITRRAWHVLAITSVTSFLVALDTTIVSVALPEIARDFPDTRRATLTWIFTAYNVGIATLLLLSGKMADRHGRKTLFLGGLGVFLFGSVLAGLAPSIGVLIAARVVQSVGGAMTGPAAIALLLPEFPPERRSFAIGLWGSTAGLSAAAAPTLGSLIIDAGGWRWAFLINIPGVAAGLIAGSRVLRQSYGENRRARFDPIGVPVGSAGVGLVVFGIAQQGAWGWGDTRIIASFVVGALAVGVLVRRSLTHPSPLLNLDLFRQRSFSVGAAAQCLFAAAFFGWVVLVPTFYTTVWGYSSLRAGLAVTPAPLLAGIVSPFAGRWADRVGHRLMCTIGCSMCAVALLWWAILVGRTPSYWAVIFPAAVVSGIGSGLTFSTFVSAAMRDVPAPHYATAGSARNTTFQMATALGIAVSVAILGDGRTPDTVVTAFHRVWLLSAILFAAAAATMWFLYRGRPNTR